MLRREGSPLGAVTRGVGPRRGWGSLGAGAYVAFRSAGCGPSSRDLDVGRVLRNEREEQRVLVHQHRGVWQGVRVAHLPLFLSPVGIEQTEVTEKRAEVLVPYAALVRRVELLVGGELTHGSARELSDSGWGLRMVQEEQVRCLRALAQWTGPSEPWVLVQPRPAEPPADFGNTGGRVTRPGFRQLGAADSVSVVWTMPEPPADLSGEPEARRQKAEEAWMGRLAVGDLTGPAFPEEQYLRLRDQELAGNPRSSPEYQQQCLDAVGLGAVPDAAR